MQQVADWLEKLGLGQYAERPSAKAMAVTVREALLIRADKVIE
jgi:hypothetical protein